MSSEEPRQAAPNGAAAAERAALEGLLVEIATTKAPTGSERARGEVVARHWRQAGLDPRFDAVGNVVAALPAPAGRAPRLLVAVHLDSVFGPEVDVGVDRSAPTWLGAGLGDNAASLAVITHWVKSAPGGERPSVTLAATVGEEGLGDLRGARHLVDELGEEHDLFVAVDGYLGSIADVAVGSRRYEATFRAGGGHSWGDYPAPSAVHAAGAAVANLAALHVPKSPRSSLNVGQIWGGTSINAIAAEAGFNLDLRSIDAESLSLLEEAALGAVRRAADEQSVDLELVRVGDRPAGSAPNRDLVAAAERAYEAVGVTPSTGPGSTDANAAHAAGLRAISFGVYRGGRAHRTDEWVDPASLSVGVRAWRELLAQLART